MERGRRASADVTAVVGRQSLVALSDFRRSRRGRKQSFLDHQVRQFFEAPPTQFLIVQQH